jgi:hypothetical protein
MYRTFSEIAPHINESTDPLFYCLPDNVNKSFHIGSMAQNYKMTSPSCQALASSVCALDWSGSCEILSHDPTVLQPSTLPIYANFPGNQSMTYGDILVWNTAFKKYGDFSGCKTQSYYFDPTVANSPLITEPVSRNVFVPLTVDPKKIDSDPVMNKMLMKPLMYYAILMNIKNTCKYKRINLTQTKLGKILQQL